MFISFSFLLSLLSPVLPVPFSLLTLTPLSLTGPVTNALIIPAPANMFLPDSRPGILLPRFSRHLNPSEQGEGVETGGVCLRLAPHTQVIIFGLSSVFALYLFSSGGPPWLNRCRCDFKRE